MAYIPNKKIRKVKFDHWRTPKELFDHYDATYHFDLDAWAAHWNHLCGKYFTKDDSR